MATVAQASPWCGTPTPPGSPPHHPPAPTPVGPPSLVDAKGALREGHATPETDRDRVLDHGPRAPTGAGTPESPTPPITRR